MKVVYYYVRKTQYPSLKCNYYQTIHLNVSIFRKNDLCLALNGQCPFIFLYASAYFEDICIQDIIVLSMKEMLFSQALYSVVYGYNIPALKHAAEKKKPQNNVAAKIKLIMINWQVIQPILQDCYNLPK